MGDPQFRLLAEIGLVVSRTTEGVVFLSKLNNTSVLLRDTAEILGGLQKVKIRTPYRPPATVSH